MPSTCVIELCTKGLAAFLVLWMGDPVKSLLLWVVYCVNCTKMRT